MCPPTLIIPCTNRLPARLVGRIPSLNPILVCLYAANEAGWIAPYNKQDNLPYVTTNTSHCKPLYLSQVSS